MYYQKPIKTVVKKYKPRPKTPEPEPEPEPIVEEEVVYEKEPTIR